MPDAGKPEEYKRFTAAFLQTPGLYLNNRPVGARVFRPFFFDFAKYASTTTVVVTGSAGLQSSYAGDNGN